MIQCPNCKEQIADDSAHCGFCGHQLKGGASKTMFGMAPVSADDIQAATEAAKAASKASSGLPKPGGLNLPKPSGTGSGPAVPRPNLPKPGGLNLPKPGGDADEDAADVSAGVPPDEAKTEMMEPVSGLDATAAELPTPTEISAPGAINTPEPAGGAITQPNPATPGVGDDPAAPNKTPMWGEQASTPAASQDDSWGDSPQVSSDDSWGDSAQVSSDDSWGDSSTATTTPDAPAAGNWDQSMPQEAPSTPLASGGGGGGGFPMGSDKKDDQKKMIIYIVAGVGGLMFLCCIISTILSFIL